MPNVKNYSCCPFAPKKGARARARARGKGKWFWRLTPKMAFHSFLTENTQIGSKSMKTCEHFVKTHFPFISN